MQKLDEHYVVARYTCVPGVCIEVGRQRFGINLGGLVEEQSTILDADNPNPVDAQIQCRIIRPWGESESAWNFGWQQTYLIQKYQNKLASSEGTASWGVNLGVGGLSSNFSMGYSSKQRTLLFAGDGHLSIDQDAQNWKGFNLYNASVAGDFAGLSFKTQTSKNENN